MWSYIGWIDGWKEANKIVSFCLVGVFNTVTFFFFCSLRNNKKECELNTAVGHWRNLEAALNSKEADYTNLLSTNRRLENDISDLKTQVSNVSLNTSGMSKLSVCVWTSVWWSRLALETFLHRPVVVLLFYFFNLWSSSWSRPCRTPRASSTPSCFAVWTLKIRSRRFRSSSTFRNISVTRSEILKMLAFFVDGFV